MIRIGYLKAKVMYNAIPYMFLYRVIAHACTELTLAYTYIIPYGTGSSIHIV